MLNWYVLEHREIGNVEVQKLLESRQQIIDNWWAFYIVPSVEHDKADMGEIKRCNSCSPALVFDDAFLSVHFVFLTIVWQIHEGIHSMRTVISVISVISMWQWSRDDPSWAGIFDLHHNQSLCQLIFCWGSENVFFVTIEVFSHFLQYLSSVINCFSINHIGIFPCDYFFQLIHWRASLQRHSIVSLIECWKRVNHLDCVHLILPGSCAQYIKICK